MKPEIKLESVFAVVESVAKQLKQDRVNALRDKTKSGITVGDFTIVETEVGYSVMCHGDIIQEHIGLLETAILVIDRYATNKIADMIEILNADREFIKHKSDILHYEHIIQTTTDVETKIVAMDRLEIASIKMKAAKKIIDSKRIGKKSVNSDK